MKFFNFFKKKEEKSSVPLGELGNAFSSIYGTKDFPRYNPDELLINKGQFVYNRMMQDDQVKAVMLFKQMAVASRKYFFDVRVDEMGQVDEDQKKIADFFMALVQNIEGSWSDKLIEILSAMKYGFSIVEKVYSPFLYDSKEYWGIKDLKLRPFTSFDGGFKVDKHGNILEVVQGTSDLTTINIPINKLIHFVYQPEIDRHYGESDLKAAYRPYWSKDIAIKFENIHLERHAHGFIWASVDPTKGVLTPAQLTDLENVLKNITAKTSLHVPASVDINTVQPLRTDAYDKAISRHNRAIAKSLLVPNLLGISEQGSHGSFAQSQTQLESFFWVLDYITVRLEEVLNEQLFKDLALWNFGTKDFPLFKFEPISDSKKLEIVAKWNELVKGRSVVKSDSDEDYIRNILGFPKRDESEKEEEPDNLNPVEEPDEIEIEDWLRNKTDYKEFIKKPWLKRINFIKIEKSLNKQDQNFAQELSLALGQVKQNLEKQIVKIGGEKSWGNINPQEINTLAIPAMLVSKIRKVIRDNIKEVLEDNYEIAKRELPVKKFVQVAPGMTKDKAMRYLSSNAMRGAQKVERDVLDAVRNVLQNSIKYDKSLKDTMVAIERDTALTAILPKINDTGRALNIPHRIETIVRTNTSDAMNQARMSLFSDKSLKGFVQAYEYSAVLDDRTTEICEHLNGKVLRDFGSYMPPNHFNCRSLLAPVTEIDDWNGKESSNPTKEPQKGFA